MMPSQEPTTEAMTDWAVTQLGIQNENICTRCNAAGSFRRWRALINAGAYAGQVEAGFWPESPERHEENRGGDSGI
jgi:hypothetical protein